MGKKATVKESCLRAPTRLAAAVVLSTVGLQGQSARPPIAATAGTGSIRGRVLTAGTDTPLRNTRVELEDEAGRVVATVLADSEGRFALTSVGAGIYSLAIRRTTPGRRWTCLATRRHISRARR